MRLEVGLYHQLSSIKRSLLTPYKTFIDSTTDVFPYDLQNWKISAYHKQLKNILVVRFSLSRQQQGAFTFRK